MDKANGISIGRIVRTHGLEGAVILKIDTHEPEDFKEQESVFVEIDEILIPFFVASYRVRNTESVIVKFDDIDSEEEAKDILQCDVYIHHDALPTDDDETPIQSLIGLQAFTSQQQPIGEIVGVLDIPNNEQFELEYKGQSLLIPINDDWIVEFDDKQIIFDLPDGLLELHS